MNSENFINHCGHIFERVTKTYPEGELLIVGIANDESGIKDIAKYTDNTSAISFGIAYNMLRDKRIKEIIEKSLIAYNLLMDMRNPQEIDSQRKDIGQSVRTPCPKKD